MGVMEIWIRKSWGTHYNVNCRTAMRSVSEWQTFPPDFIITELCARRGGRVLRRKHFIMILRICRYAVMQVYAKFKNFDRLIMILWTVSQTSKVNQINSGVQWLQVRYESWHISRSRSDRSDCSQTISVVTVLTYQHVWSEIVQLCFRIFNLCGLTIHTLKVWEHMFNSHSRKQSRRGWEHF